jgi:hypothetical protein
MSLLVNLPIQVSLSILLEWITLVDLTSLDIAFCSHPRSKSVKSPSQALSSSRLKSVSRQDYLQILQDSNFILRHSPMSFLCNDTTPYICYLKWLAKRGIKSDKLWMAMKALPEVLSFDHLNLSKVKELSFHYQPPKKNTDKKGRIALLSSFIAGEDTSDTNESSSSVSGQLWNLVSSSSSTLASLLTGGSPSLTFNLEQNKKKESSNSCLDDTNLLLFRSQLPVSLEKVSFSCWSSITDNQLNLLLSKSNIRLRSLDLSRCSTITDDSIVLILQQYSQTLEEMNLSCCSSLTGLFFPVIKSLCRCFSALNISYCHSLVAEHLSLFLSEYKELSSLACEDLMIINNTLLEMFVTNNQKISYLNIDYCRNITIDILNILLKKQPKLQYFISKDCCYYVTTSSSFLVKNGDGVRFITSPLTSNIEIKKELVLKGCYTRQTALVQLLSNFPNTSLSESSGSSVSTTGLQSINASECRKLGNVSVLTIANKFGSSLLSLKLSPWKDIEENTFITLFQQCRLLQIINLSFSETLNDNVLTTIARNIPNLQEFYINSCPLISDTGMISVIQSCMKLRILEMENCLKITNLTISHIFNCSFSLCKINIIATSITNECYELFIFQNSLHFETFQPSIVYEEEVGEDGLVEMKRKDNYESYWMNNSNRDSFVVLISDYLRDSQYWKTYSLGNTRQKKILKNITFVPTTMSHST